MAQPNYSDSDIPLDIDALKDKYTRALADLENLRKRKTKEIDAARDQGEIHVATAFLPIVDDFQRALRVLSDPTTGITKEQILDDVNLLFRKFIHTLEQLEIDGFKAEGQMFAAELMEAVAQVPSRTLPPGTVAAELAQGFTRRGKLLRPAQVTVSVAEENSDERDPT